MGLIISFHVQIFSGFLNYATVSGTGGTECAVSWLIFSVYNPHINKLNLMDEGKNASHTVLLTNKK